MNISLNENTVFCNLCILTRIPNRHKPIFLNCALTFVQDTIIDSGLQDICENCLADMKDVSERQMRHNEDPRLRQKYAQHLARWQEVLLSLENVHVMLEQVPQKWDEYHRR